MKMISFATPGFLKAWNKIYSDNKDLSPRLAYKAKSLNDYLASQNKRFLELREAILKKYGNKDDNGELITKDGQVEFKVEHLEDVNKEFAELLQLDLEPGIPSRLKLEELERDGIKLSGPDMATLSELLNLDEQEGPKFSVVPKPSN